MKQYPPLSPASKQAIWEALSPEARARLNALLVLWLKQRGETA